MPSGTEEMSLPSQEGSSSKRAPSSPQETTLKSKRVRFEDKNESVGQILPGPSQALPPTAQDAAPSSDLSSDETISTPGSACDRLNLPEPISETFPERKMVVKRSLGDGITITECSITHRDGVSAGYRDMDMIARIPPGIYEDMIIDHGGLTLTKKDAITPVPRHTSDLAGESLDGNAPQRPALHMAGSGSSIKQSANRGEISAQGKRINRITARPPIAGNSGEDSRDGGSSDTDETTRIISNQILTDYILIDYTIFIDCHFLNCSGKYLDLRGCSFAICNFTASTLSDCFFARSHIQRCRLTGCTFSSSTISLSDANGYTYSTSNIT